ncbi:leucine-rich-repeats and calponin homology domain protein isoform 1-T1 [Glossina fuscipes fuscipes]
MRMAATVAVYNRLHNNSVGVVGGGVGLSGSGGSGGGGHHHQLARSLERILEEAHLSGELILTNRKLKDFPKTGTKYILTDTVIADLSRNRFCELPEEITTFSFLETLLLYHNTIRSVPESVKHLTSLTYLDLRSNQLSSLPRELCFLPLQVLLVSNNRLTALPDELGRMDRLTDLDASYNQLTSLPARIGELRLLRSFSLRSNQLMYLPRELTCLTLVSLDVSNNRISSLPLEIRQMTTLVELNLENNPLTSPPASLCIRGLVHVFKYLETQATKDEKGSRAGGNYDGYTTLRRAPRHNVGGSVLETNRLAHHHIDSGYSTCDGIDKRWSHDMPLKCKHEPSLRLTPTTPPKSTLLNADLMDSSLTSSTSTIVDESLAVNAAVVKPLNVDVVQTATRDSAKLSLTSQDDISQLSTGTTTATPCSTSSSNDPSPELDDGLIEHQQHMQQQQQQLSLFSGKIDDKTNKNIGNIQTYREYKEALKQQRSQDVYRIKENQKQLSDSTELLHSVVNACNEQVDIRLNNVNAQNATVPKSIMKTSTNNPSNSAFNVCPGGAVNNASTNGPSEDCLVIPKKPIQKVIPSRNTELMSQTVKSQISAELMLNEKSSPITNGDCIGYVKPNSPLKTINGNAGSGNANGVSGIGVGILTNNNKFTTNGGIKSPVGNATKLGTSKTHRNVTWNHDIPPEKLSFTMRREFDRQREEIELMTQLRSIIETRLKMTLPEDIASALTDGVILCHLANYVRPRSVASIHVPSPGVSKLTMARCRRNVDNFLEACRKIGVDEELICSCSDVIPSFNSIDEVDNAVTKNSNTSQANCNNNYSSAENELELKRTQSKTLPNPTAVLKTVAALIALDCNPHHRNVQNLQQQREFQMKLQMFQRQQELPKQRLLPEYMLLNKKGKTPNQRRCVLLEGLNEEDTELEAERRELNDQYDGEEQKQLTATCTKEQMMIVEYENSNYEFDNNFNKGHCSDQNKHELTNGQNEDSGNDDVDGDTVRAGERPRHNNIYRYAKLKTFQKIKLNLITAHGNNGNAFGNFGHPQEDSILQTIVENENDAITPNISSANTEVYQIIDEKVKCFNNELPLKITNIGSQATTTTTAITPNKYKLLELPSMGNSADKSNNFTTTANSVSKRIEFFEHANIPNGGIIKPKTNIYSIYRGNDRVEDDKLVEQLVKNKEAGASAAFLLRHDSHVLTVILSCVFIVTFLLLVFFPLPG